MVVFIRWFNRMVPALMNANLNQSMYERWIELLYYSHMSATNPVETSLYYPVIIALMFSYTVPCLIFTLQPFNLHKMQRMSSCRTFNNKTSFLLPLLFFSSYFRVFL